ncbi:MAG TPA: universal stress protein [Bauldia sp.]|nr:universal stress protein [Bauldia sp.]
MAKSGSALKDITVIVDNGGERWAARAAVELARTTGAHLTGIALAVDPLLPIYTVAAPIPTDFIVAAHEQGIADAKAALAAFDEIGRAAGISTEGRLAESISGDFSGVIRNAILTDLAMVGQNDPSREEPLREALIEALLFQAGLPTLLVPYSGAREFRPDKAVIAWNGTAQAARAIRAAMPLLAGAKSVLVAIVDEGASPSDSVPGADVGTYLARHDLDVAVRTIANAHEGAGQALLTLAAEEDATWVVMGAYGHSRIRQFLLGGVTRYVLGNATLPVLLAH